MLTDDEQKSIWASLEERFGIPSRLTKNYTLWEKGKTFWALSESPPPVNEMASLKVISVGIPLLRKVRDHLKPTTVALRLLSGWIVRSRIFLDEAMVLELLLKGEIPWCRDVVDGYVLLETTSGVLGCGLLLRGKLRSQIPKSETAAFLSWVGKLTS